jgi:hypothetical protein
MAMMASSDVLEIILESEGSEREGSEKESERAAIGSRE